MIKNLNLKINKIIKKIKSKIITLLFKSKVKKLFIILSIL